MGVEKRRRAVVEALLASREFIAAGFRSPSLVDTALHKIPREHRDALARFMGDLQRCFARCDARRNRSGSPSGATSPRRSPRGPSSDPVSPMFVASSSFTATAFKEAVVGCTPPPTKPDNDDLWVNAKFKRGLIHGEVGPMFNFLRDHQMVEVFLARRLLELSEGSPFGADSTDSDDPLEPQALFASPTLDGRPLPSDYLGSPTTEPGDEDVETFPLESLDVTNSVSVMDAFTVANMVWVQAHPLDMEPISRHSMQIARLRAQELHDGHDEETSAMARRSLILLRANLELHYPQAEWETLLVARDAAIEEFARLHAAMIASVDASHAEDQRTARLRLARSLSNCTDSLGFVRFNASPAELKESIRERITRLLADVTAAVHESGISVGAAAPEAAERKKSFLSRIGSKKADPMDDVAREAHRITMAAKHHLRFIMSGAAPDTPADEDDAPSANPSDEAALPENPVAVDGVAA